MDSPAAPSTQAASVSSDRKHDVTFTTSARRSFMGHAHRGVTIADDHIAWTFDGKPDGAPFKNIVAVSLQSGGSWQAPLNLCQIVFADRYKLIVTNGNDLGLANDEQRRRYRDFLHDLHARLAAHAATRTGTPIAFSAGYPAGRYLWLLILSVVLGIITVGVPLVALLITGEVRPLMLLIVGAIFMWPLKTMMKNNTPRSYDPAKPPAELLG